MKIGMAIIGAPIIAQIRWPSGKYQYPSRIENDVNNINMSKIESINNIMSCLLDLDKLIN
jgi:hypothetical protein